VKHPLAIPALTVLVLLGALPLWAQQVTCTSSVIPRICKQFDLSFGPTSMWAAVNFAKGVEIVVVEPGQFKAERAKFDAEKEAAARSAKSVGDINHAGGREAGKGVFGREILECPTSSMIKRIVISTEAASDSIGELSDQLLFYVIGYDQGLIQGMANLQP
jgi:hypothetical protein